MGRDFFKFFFLLSFNLIICGLAFALFLSKFISFDKTKANFTIQQQKLKGLEGGFLFSDLPAE